MATTVPREVHNEREPSMVIVTEWVMCEPSVAFDGASAIATLPNIFQGNSSVPGVVSARMEKHDEGVTEMTLGETRIVHTDDGASVRERYVQVDRPHAYAYEMAGLNPPLSSIMTHAVGEWRFAGENLGSAAGTRITWTYSAFPKSAVTRPATAALCGLFLKDAMRSCLSQLKTMCEYAVPPRWVPTKGVSACPLCTQVFMPPVVRYHHCRACGQVACDACTLGRGPVPQLGITADVRLCRTCDSGVQGTPMKAAA
jgi:hypothetical protein